MSDQRPLLYVKTHCPYCVEVVAFLEEHGIGHRRIDVLEDPAAFAEMKRKSGQDKAPTLDWRGDILADFGVEELVPFLHKKAVKLEES